MQSTTSWTKGPGEVPLYSDWKVSFTTTGGAAIVFKNDIDKDSTSVSTASLSSLEDTAESQSDFESYADSDDNSKVDNNNLTSDEWDQSQDEQSSGTFFSVHRNMIGPKSAFFTQSFVGKSESETVNSSVIALPADLPSHTFSSVVEAFELILDYCYNGYEKIDAEKKLTTENAVAMFCLCNFFEMDSEICEFVLEFIKSDLSHETIANYYQIVKDMTSSVETTLVLNAKPIMEMIVSMCHQGPSVLDCESALFQVADLSLWLSIYTLLENEQNKSAELSKVWSENITNFFDTYKEDDLAELKNIFRTFTAEDILPEVSSKAALRLLEYEHKYGFDLSKNGAISTPEEFIESSMLTSLQQRCIKALRESNWTGKENDIGRIRKKLINITTPAVLEALLIDSVSSTRSMISKIEQMTAEVDSKKNALAEEIEIFESRQSQAIQEKKEQLKLQRELAEIRKQNETLQLKLKKVEDKAETDKTELRKANALLEAELDEEKKKSFALRQRFREAETAQVKIESDRENFKLTIQETIKQLEAITTYNEPYDGCGLGHLVMLVSSFSDRNECRQIKNMLQQVIKDPNTYERDFLLKSKTRDECAESMLSLTDGEFTS